MGEDLAPIDVQIHEFCTQGRSLQLGRPDEVSISPVERTDAVFRAYKQ